MPRTRSSKKPGCFNHVKPTLMFTDSPPERLPKRLCSPTSAADNPVTAQVLYMEDGLETTWVSPQFHPSMLQMEDAPRRRRRKQDGTNAGKSAMVSQHTTRKRRPVLKSSSTTPNTGERRFPKGFQPLQFLGDSSRNRRDGDDAKRRMGFEDEDEDVTIDDGEDNGVGMEDNTTLKIEQGRKNTSTRNVLQRLENEEWMETGMNDYSSNHSNRNSLDASHRLQNLGKENTNRSSVTRPRTSFVRGCFDNNHHPYREEDDGGGEGDLHNPRLTALRDKPVTNKNSNQRHHISHHPQDLLVECDENFRELDDTHDQGPLRNESYCQSPKFDSSKRKTRGEAARKKLETFAASSLHIGDVHVIGHQDERYLLKELNRTGHDVLDSREKVLAADTPVSDYGVRVSLRRRRHLLPKNYTEKLLLDS